MSMLLPLCGRLNRVPLRTHAYPQNVTLFGNIFFADVIKVMIKMRSYVIIEWALNPMWVSLSETEKDTEEGSMNTEAETAVRPVSHGMSKTAGDHQKLISP